MLHSNYSIIKKSLILSIVFNLFLVFSNADEEAELTNASVSENNNWFLSANSGLVFTDVSLSQKGLTGLSSSRKSGLRINLDFGLRVFNNYWLAPSVRLAKYRTYYKFTGGSSTLSLRYIEASLPLMYRYEINQILAIFGYLGPVFGFLLDDGSYYTTVLGTSTGTRTSTTLLKREFATPMTLGLETGVGLEYKFTCFWGLRLNAGYHQGITDIMKDATVSGRISSIVATGGVSFYACSN